MLFPQRFVSPFIFLALLLAVGAIILLCTVSHTYAGELSPGLSERLQSVNAREYLSVIVRMEAQADLHSLNTGITGRKKALRSRRVIRALQVTAKERQTDLVTFLEKEKASGSLLSYTPFWIFNGLSLKATPEVIKKVASRNDVGIVTEDAVIPPPVFLPAAPLQTNPPYTWNIEKIKAPDAWDLGYNGSGVVVGIFDTGVEVDHPDLASKYRGGNNSWFDPHGEHTTPVDAAGKFTGHGTAIAGIILGGNASETYIGVAPGAKWIAARIWNDNGEEAPTSDVHKIFEWFMDPDGDPETDDFPDVVNNSWGFKLFETFPWCLPDFQDDIIAWRAAGIVPVFAAGNNGPWFFTGESPGNYPATISVGATDFEDAVAFFSSRGPNNCNLSIFPDISAPGFAIFSSAPGEGYSYVSGTSAATPHVTGTIALLLDANPNLSVKTIESTLQQTATPLGFFQPNFDSGWGRIDALKAVNAVIPD